MENNLSQAPATYDAAYQELALIAQQLESDQISVDLLAIQIERAAFLDRKCVV